MIQLEKTPYYTKSFTRGTYQNHQFTICEENGELYVAFHDWVDIETYNHHKLLEEIKTQYLNETNRQK